MRLRSTTCSGPAELVVLARAGRRVGRLHRRIGDIADINRLHARTAVAEQRQRGCYARHRGEGREEMVAGPEHHAGLQQGGAGKFRAHDALTVAARRDVGRIGIGIAADAGHVDQALRAGRGGQARDAPRALHMHVGEAVAPRLHAEAYRVDHEIDAGHRGRHRFLAADVRRHRRDLADLAHRLQEERGLGIAHRRTHDDAALR
jgi:hypothetical protein